MKNKKELYVGNKKLESAIITIITSQSQHPLIGVRKLIFFPTIFNFPAFFPPCTHETVPCTIFYILLFIFKYCRHFVFKSRLLETPAVINKQGDMGSGRGKTEKQILCAFNWNNISHYTDMSFPTRQQQNLWFSLCLHVLCFPTFSTAFSHLQLVLANQFTN